MAQVISPTDYQAIAIQYSNARNRALTAKDYLFEAVYTIVLFDEITPTIDLINEFYNSYNINADVLNSPVTYLSAVKSLNNHVLNRSTATSIDSYLTDNGIAVPRGWADLSSAAGFSISESNIDDNL